MLAIVLLSTLVGLAQCHMSIWHPSVYGLKLGLQVGIGAHGPQPFDQWWFHGPDARAAAPQPGNVYNLVAGSTATFEIACGSQYTTAGGKPRSVTVPGSKYDACPWGPGAYHIAPTANDTFNTTYLSGCALGIADKDNINNVGPNDITIFSVQPDCVRTKMTTFDVPARMPPCTGSKCICSWYWLPQTGSGNYWQTAFDCNVTGSPIDATPIAPPQRPTWCDATKKGGNVPCVSGAKQPIYWWNDMQNPVNKPTTAGFLYHRPAYVPQWSYQPGAQNDIFMPPGTPLGLNNISALPGMPSTASSSSIVLSTSVVAKTSTVQTTTRPLVTLTAPLVTLTVPPVAPVAAAKTTSTSSSSSSSKKAKRTATMI